jgi:putative redox protein
MDEPEKSGGKGRGPDPTTLILSALAACTVATLRMYIDRKGWDIPHLQATANMYREIRDGKSVNVIDRIVNFLTPVTVEQRERLIQIAKLCPVSKLLEAGVKINTTGL